MQRYIQAFDSLLGRSASASLQHNEKNPEDQSFMLADRLDELLKVHEYERQRLGQELHDTAGQLVVALQLSIANLRNADADESHAGLFEEIQDTVRRIDQELRSLAFLHYPAELGDRSLGSAVRALVQGFGRRTGIEAKFDSAGETADVSQPAAIALLRVAQEALVNIHRHSQATVAKVLLQRRADEIRLTVSDNGVGLPRDDRVPKSPGIGLQGMRHRVEALGGRFGLRNLKQGLRITAVVPIARKAVRLRASTPE